jgi:hypothetical protein
MAHPSSWQADLKEQRLLRRTGWMQWNAIQLKWSSLVKPGEGIWLDCCWKQWRVLGINSRKGPTPPTLVKAPITATTKLDSYTASAGFGDSHSLPVKISLKEEILMQSDGTNITT